MSKIDKIDKIILSALARDCRQSLSNIAKEIRRSPQFVKYRIDKLKEHAIKNTPLLLDYLALGYVEVSALLKLPLLDPLLERTLIDYLFKRTETYKLCSVQGSHDIYCSFIVKDLEEIEGIKEELQKLAQVDIVFMSNYQTERYGLKYLSEKKENSVVKLGGKNEQSEEEERDKKILSLLQANPYRSLLEISQELHITYEKVAYSFKHNKIFKGNTLLLSEREVERQLILCSSKDIKRITSYCRMNQYVIELNKIIGDYDCLLIIEAEHNVRAHSKQILYELKDKISKYNILYCTNWYKYGWNR